ncbi:MAG TPA: ice-binding family protein [Bacteroidota bacterium]
MKQQIIGTRSLAQLAKRTSVAVSAFLAVLFLAACDVNAPQNQTDQGPLSHSGGSHGPQLLLTSAVPLGSASTFVVLAGTTVTNDGPSLITGDVGVSPGTALTGFQPAPVNSISGPGTVTAGLGVVLGTIYAGGPVAAQAHNDATIAYNYLVAQVPDTIYSGVTQLDGMTFTPGVYSFAPSANLQVNGTVYLDFQGNSDALFIFQLGSTLVTMTGSNVVALNSNIQDCIGANVFWAVGSSATIDGAHFIGTVIAHTTITMTSGANVSGRMLALGGAVTMITDTIAVCGSSDGGTFPPKPCRDFVTGGGWIKGNFGKNKATFGVSGGIKNGEFWGQLSYNDHKGFKLKSSSVTAYIVIDAVTRQIEGVAKVRGQGSFTYKVIVVDNGEPGRNDSFSIEVSNGYSASGDLKGGNIQLHRKCNDERDGKGGKGHRDSKEKYDDNDEHEGHKNCDRD